MSFYNKPMQKSLIPTARRSNSTAKRELKKFQSKNSKTKNKFQRPSSTLNKISKFDNR